MILCIDSAVSPTEDTTKWMMELVNRCNMKCEYKAMMCELKLGVVIVGSQTAGIRDAAELGTFIMTKGFTREGTNPIYATDDYTAKKNMKSMPPSSGLPPSYSA